MFRYRIVSAPASLPLMPTPNNASGSTVAPHERQRRKTKVNSSYAAMTAVLRDRAAKGNKFTTQNSVQEVLKPEVSSCPFGYFWVGALRKHAGGMFLASDLGGYAAAASIWNYTAKLEPLRQLTQYSVGGFLNRRFKLSFWSLLGRGVKKTCQWHVFSLRSRRLCRRSVHLCLHSMTRPKVPRARKREIPSRSTE